MKDLLCTADLTANDLSRHEPDAAVVRVAEELSRRSDSLVTVTHDPLKAVAGANAVTSRPIARSASRRSPLFGSMRRSCPKPSRTPRSLVFDQAENRLHTAPALMAALLGKRLEGASR